MITATTTRRQLLSQASLIAILLAVTAMPARADITAFLGVSPTPERHAVRGFSAGLSLVIVGFEFEYSQIAEDEAEVLPGLKTYSGNVFVQTPTEVKGTTFYATAGAGGYRETLDSFEETHVGLNIGAGAKVRLVGPVRVRVDYRIFKLQGSPLYDRYHRFYVGGNIAF